MTATRRNELSEGLSMARKGWLWCLALFLVAASAASAAPLKLVEREVYTVLIPRASFTGSFSVWKGVSLSANLKHDGSKVLVEGREDWKTAGFPSLIEARLAKVKMVRKENRAEVTFRFGPMGYALRLNVEGVTEETLPSVLGEVAIAGPSSGPQVKESLDSAYALLAGNIFTGPLAAIPRDRQLLLLSFAHLTAEGTTIGNASFKDNAYLAVDLGEDPNVYNTLQLNQTQRVAKIVNERLLVVIKAFAAPAQGAAPLHGLKLQLRIPYKDFLQQYAVPQYDTLELYLPLESIARFTDAEITSQELIDQSVVLVNSNRLQIPLAGS